VGVSSLPKTATEGSDDPQGLSRFWEGMGSKTIRKPEDLPIKRYFIKLFEAKSVKVSSVSNKDSEAGF
jgi:hypothetical protein